MRSKIGCGRQTLALIVIFCGAWFAACDGSGGGGGILGGDVGDSCRTKDDCDSDLYCRGPNQPNVCGIPPRERCASDTDCPMGTVCHAVYDGCSPDGIGSECMPPCTAMSCGTDFRCNVGGACEPTPCNEGFTCPDWQKCDPVAAHAMGPIHARTFGCVNITCSDDSVCPTGKVCVTEYCQNGAGSCVENIAVP
jgi:hypothetical protein